MNEPINSEMGYVGADEDGSMRALAARWREALDADGWTREFTYPGILDASTHHERDGWTVSIYEQNALGPWHIHICAWGPDELAVALPPEYDFEQMVANLNKCDFCGATGTRVRRVAFANCACDGCYAEARRKLGCD